MAIRAPSLTEGRLLIVTAHYSRGITNTSPVVNCVRKEMERGSLVSEMLLTFENFKLITNN